jgi:hypothetical protein
MIPCSIKLIRDSFIATGVVFGFVIATSGFAFAKQRTSMQHCTPDAERLFEDYVIAANETPANVGQFFSQIFLAATVNDLLNTSPNSAISSIELERRNLLLARGSQVEKKVVTCNDTGCKVRTTMIEKQGVRHSFVLFYSSPVDECGSMLIDRWELAVPL